ncbi:MAG: ribonuclease P protein component [Atopobiaceae bacterium]|jgi:ribonuclease P protein component|nr:ribonuclease P protein component [Atopobiaceae bacterium]
MKTIKSKKEFGRVFRSGRRFNSPLVRIAIAECDEGDQGKVAFVAAKRLGNAAFRNRCKRVLREAARSLDLSGYNKDIILFATKATHDSHPDEVAVGLSNLIGKGGR